MKINQMTIAQVQKEMSKSLGNKQLPPWTLDDEITCSQYSFNPPTVPKSRNQREGYFDGKSLGNYKFMRVKYKINRMHIS